MTAPSAASAVDTVRFGRILVTLLVDQRRWKDAEPLALRVFAIQDSLKDTLARTTAGQLATIYDGLGRVEAASRVPPAGGEARGADVARRLASSPDGKPTIQQLPRVLHVGPTWPGCASALL